VTGIYQLREGPHLAQASLRRDDSSQFGARTTGTLAYGYAVAEGLRATASFGGAFKAPTFNDLTTRDFRIPSSRPSLLATPSLRRAIQATR
jgi:vitamin B12 transporter